MAINASTGITSQGLPLATAANFPALKLFLPCYQSEIGRTYLTDIIVGRRLPVNTTVTTPASPDGYSIFPSVVANTAIAAGNSLPVIGALNCIMFSVGVFGTTAGPILGSATVTGGISLAGPQSAALFDGTNTLDNSVNGAFTGSTSAIYGRALAVNWAGNATSYEYLSTATTVTTKTGTATSTASPGTIAGGIATLGQAWGCNTNVVNLHCIGLLVFAGALPTGIPAMLGWMVKHVTVNDKLKTFYPLWRGLT